MLFNSSVVLINFFYFLGILHSLLSPLPLFLFLLSDCRLSLHLEKLSLLHFIFILLDVILFHLFMLFPNIFLECFQLLFFLLFFSFFLLICFLDLLESLFVIILFSSFFDLVYVVLDLDLLFPALKSIGKEKLAVQSSNSLVIFEKLTVCFFEFVLFNNLLEGFLFLIDSSSLKLLFLKFPKSLLLLSLLQIFVIVWPI